MDNSSNRTLQKSKTEDLEDITDITGRLGKWQLLMIMCLTYIHLPAAWYNFGIVFVAPNINHWCTKPSEFSNMTTEEWKNYSIPFDVVDGKLVYSKCEMYTFSREKNRSRIPCTSWDYDHSFYKSTITEKWNLVCDRAWLSSLIQSLYFFGYLIVSFMGGQLSDKFGRKPIFYFSVAWTILWGLICVFSQNFWLFAISRFFLSFGRASTFLILYVHLMEIVGKEQRIIIGLFAKLSWGLGQMILPGIVWLIRDWFYLDLIFCMVYVTILPLWWITTESPRWLLSKGRFQEAESIIVKVVKINNRNVENINEKLKVISERIEKESKGKDNNQITFLDVMKFSNLRRISVILYVIWISIVLSYYGLTFSADDIGVNMLLFCFLAALIEVPAALTFFYIQRRIGRKFTQIVSMMATGLTCLSAIAIPADIPVLLTAMAIVSKFSLAISFGSITLFSSEIYPTVVRNVGFGSCSMMGRIGAIIAPFMKEAASTVHRVFPLSLFGIISFIGAALVIFLPETKDLILTDTLSQGEKIGSHTFRILSRKSKNEERNEEVI